MAPRPRSDMEIVRDGHQCRVGLRRHFVEQRHDRRPGVDIEGSGGLVREDQDRSADESPRDGDTLLLTAGELVGDLVDAMPQTDALEHVGRDLATVPEHPPLRVPERHHHVVDRRTPRQEVELLEHETDVVAAKAVEATGAHPAHLPTFERDGAGGGRIQHPQDVEQRRFPRPRATHDGDVVPRSDLEGDAPKDL